jgi:uridylate kinase
MKEKALVLKFGGSQATGMEGADASYLHSFLSHIGIDLLKSYDRVGLVIGGGPRVRVLQASVEGDTAKDMIAKEAMWEHAETLRQVAGSLGLETVSRVPHSPEEMNHILKTDNNPVIAMSWLQDGQSSDTSSIMLAEKWRKEIGQAEIVILSNIAYIFTDDPRNNTMAKAIARSNVRRLVKEKVLSDDPKNFVPGGHVVIDPVGVSKLVSGHNSEMPLLFGHGGAPVEVLRFLTGHQQEQGTVLHDQYDHTAYVE